MADTATRQHAVDTASDPITISSAKSLAGIIRILLGFTFLWAFLDKTFGLGYATPEAKAWLFGTGDGSPTTGFLAYGVNQAGPFADFFTGLAPEQPGAVTNWLFMLALLGAGVGLILGVGMKISSIGATVLLFLMYLAVAPWAKYVDEGGATVASNNPIMDEHIIYGFMLIFLMLVHAGRYVGLGRKWEAITPSWLH